MCHSKDLFKTFESLDGGKVLLGNNLACKVVGLGTVSVKIFDGVSKDLEQVRYVPDLKRNLISLGMLDQLGCSIKAEHGQIQIMNKGTVIIKGIRMNGLYVLVGALSKPGVNASVSNDKTKLWQMRLAHISERGLRKLEKQRLFCHDHITQLDFCEDVYLERPQDRSFIQASMKPNKH